MRKYTQNNRQSRPIQGGDLILTGHADERSGQRRIRREDILYVCRYGQKLHRTGACFFFLGKKDVPPGHNTHHLVGTVVLTKPGEKPGDLLIVTVYKNKEALRTIKKKLKHRLPWLSGEAKRRTSQAREKEAL
jgi:hypothetical protein